MNTIREREITMNNLQKIFESVIIVSEDDDYHPALPPPPIVRQSTPRKAQPSVAITSSSPSEDLHPILKPITPRSSYLSGWAESHLASASTPDTAPLPPPSQLSATATAITTNNVVSNVNEMVNTVAEMPSVVAMPLVPSSSSSAVNGLHLHFTEDELKQQHDTQTEWEEFAEHATSQVCGQSTDLGVQKFVASVNTSVANKKRSNDGPLSEDVDMVGVATESTTNPKPVKLRKKVKQEGGGGGGGGATE